MAVKMSWNMHNRLGLQLLLASEMCISRNMKSKKYDTQCESCETSTLLRGGDIVAQKPYKSKCRRNDISSSGVGAQCVSC